MEDHACSSSSETGRHEDAPSLGSCLVARQFQRATFPPRCICLKVHKLWGGGGGGEGEGEGGGRGKERAII